MIEAPDPRLPQKRIGVTRSGKEVWIDISGDDRLAAINTFPGRWPEFLKMRERGEDFEAIANRAKLPREEFVTAMAQAYSILETKLHDLARARGLEIA